jgi:serine/threonine protein kinase
MPQNDRDNSHTDETESVSGYSGQPKPTPIQCLGSFKIEAIISTGGMGTVYRAYDESMKRSVALKVLHPSLEVSKKIQSRFAREAWIAGQLEHPNVIKVYSRGEENRLHYIAMELADGGSLADHINQIRVSIPSGSDVTDTVTKEYITSILRKFIDLTNALEHIHSKGFIHRDIKPHNVLISGSEKHFKLTDFGIAHAEDMTHITKAGDFIGTVRYMSPELLTAHRAVVDKRTDIYSLGVTLYEALTLTSPFEADSEEKFITEILSGHAIPARKRNRRLPRDLETVLMKATHQDPRKRYQSAAEFAGDLERILSSRPVLAKREGIVARSWKYLRRNKKIVVAITAAVMFTIAGSYSFIDWRSEKFDIERINKVLEAVVATKTSPFELNAEWSRLWKVLYERIERGGFDSTLMWFFRASTVHKYDIQEYSMFEKARIGISHMDIDILESHSVPSGRNCIAAVSSAITISVDDSDFVPFDNLAECYASSATGSITVGGPLRDYFGYIPSGRHLLQVRTVSEHYLDVSLYRRESNYDLERSDKPSMAVTTGRRDSLVRLGACNCQPVTLREPSLIPVSPVFVDTTVDSFYVWLFDEYPADFPKRIFEPSKVKQYDKAFSIRKVTISKDRSGRYRTDFVGFISKDLLEVPIAALFQVIDRRTDRTVLKGYLRLSVHSHLDISYHDEISGSGFSLHNPDSSQVSRRTHQIDTGEWTFDELVNLGCVDAKFVAVPSIEAARFFGDVYEFWGDTLVFDIKFQAFDSSGTN